MIKFNSSPKPTIGVEIELQIIDENNSDLKNVASRVLADIDKKFAPQYENSIILDSKKLYNTKNVSAITVEDVLNSAKQHLNY